MKKLFLGLILLSSTGIFDIYALAEEGENPANVTFQEGEFSVSFNNGTIDFPKVEPVVYGRKLYYPTIKKNSFLDAMDPNLNSDWNGNPLSEDYSDVIGHPPAPGWGELLQTVKVSNYSDVNEWRVKLSRTPMTNKDGEQIKNDYLFIGNIRDYSDIYKYNRTVVSENTIVNESQTTVAEFYGENSKKIHYIAPFGDIEFDYGNPQDEILTTQNIAYGINSSTIVPSSGNYSSSLIWTVEKGPKSEAIQ